MSHPQLELGDNKLTSGLDALSKCPSLCYLSLVGNRLASIEDLTPLVIMRPNSVCWPKYQVNTILFLFHKILQSRKIVTHHMHKLEYTCIVTGIVWNKAVEMDRVLSLSHSSNRWRSWKHSISWTALSPNWRTIAQRSSPFSPASSHLMG